MDVLAQRVGSSTRACGPSAATPVADDAVVDDDDIAWFADLDADRAQLRPVLQRLRAAGVIDAALGTACLQAARAEHDYDGPEQLFEREDVVERQSLVRGKQSGIEGVLRVLTWVG